MRRPRRPALADVFGYLLGLGALLALPLVDQIGLPLLMVILGGGCWLAARQPRRRIVLGGLVVLLVGFGIGTWRVAVLAQTPLAARLGHAITATPVVVNEAWRGSGYGRIAMGDVLGRGGGPVLLRLDTTVGPERGSILLVDGSLLRPRPPRDGFDETAWLAHQGIHAVLRIRSARPIGRRGGLWGISDRLRSSALHALAPAGSDDVGQLVVGLTFGGSTGLSVETVEAFRASGLAHLLAVSGGNVALLVALILLVVWVLGGTRRHALQVALGVIVVYVAIVGPSPSVLRAGIAGIVGCLAWLLGRQRDAWRAMALGFGCLIAWNPWSIYDAGLQLSFVAVAAILLVVPHARRIADATIVPYPVAVALLVTGAATVATAPISWWHFGRASVLAALPANLFAAPAVPLALWSALIATVVTPIAPAAGAGIAWCAQWPALWILWCARGGGWLAQALPVWVLPIVVAVGLLVALWRLSWASRAVGWGRVRRTTRTRLSAERQRPR